MIEHVCIQNGLDITADGRFKDVLPIILSFVDKPVDMAKFRASSRSASALCACEEVKYLWLRRQRPERALLLTAKAGGPHERLLLRLIHSAGLEGADAQDPKGNTVLHLCCAAGWDAAVELLAQAASRGTVDAKAFNKAGLAPLHIASAGGHFRCVEHLLNVRGSEANARACGGDTALYLAYESKQAAQDAGLPTECFESCVQQLLDAGGISFSGKQLALM